MTFLKLSQCFSNFDDSKKLRDVIQCFIHSNKDIFSSSSQFVNYLDEGVTGFDIITILDLNIDNNAKILKRWASLSTENRSFIIKNHLCFDLKKMYPTEKEFSSFICLISEGTSGSAESFKALMELQKDFYTAQLSKSSAVDGKMSNESFQNNTSSGSGINSDNVAVINKDSPTLGPPKFSGSVANESQGNIPSNNAMVLVDNLPPDVSIKILRKTFEFAGKFKSVSMCPGSGDSAADVEFIDAYSAYNLLRHNFERGPCIIDNHALIFLPAFEDHIWNNFNFKENEVVIWNIPNTVSKPKLRKLFSFGGQIESISIYPHDFHAVVTFLTSSSAETVHRYYNNGKDYYLDGMPLHVERYSDREGKNGNQLCIGNIPAPVNSNEIKQMFSGFGRIIKFDMRRCDQNNFYASITFENVRSAHNLLHNSYKRNFMYNGTVLKIQKVK